MFKAISDSAAAADGGSLALFAERLDGTVETFVINRSIKSHGTADHNRVSSDLRSLSSADCLAAADALEALPSKTPGTYDDADPRIHASFIKVVADFVSMLRAQGRSGREG
ncbi:hypothetical protein FFK22_039210 [Mycobacterium sp. KBS0706]|uniref:hypothetical protein n=1 Tax=Mycobacterium sp. KBS0706 TaxID=2578109 RepID=UPI00110FA8A2|nr:hypothetical protein [Mycobacterium sp. KBS0706]TSD83147.1 hypothetical protein FFK22_039210 [Mycobacterium sp. KBS0706]